MRVHTCHRHTCQGLHPTPKTSVLFKLPGLAGNYSLRAPSRRGIKNSIQTCRSGPEAYEQSFRWPPHPSPFREAGRVTLSPDEGTAATARRTGVRASPEPPPPAPSAGNPKYGMPGLQPAPPLAARSAPHHLCNHSSAHGAQNLPNRPSGSTHRPPRSGASPRGPGAPLTSTAQLKDTAAVSPVSGVSPQHTHNPGQNRRAKASPPCSPSSAGLGEAGRGRMEAAAASGCRNATLRAERRAAARAGAHLFDLVILQLGEVIGQELRGDHADGRGRGAAGVGPASVLRSPGEQWSSGGCSAAPPPPPAAAPPPRPGRRRLARSPAPRSRPRQGDSRQPAHLLGAHWLPPASAARGGGVRARAGERGGRSLPRRKGGGGAAKSPTVRHLPARPPRREPARGREARSGAQGRSWRRPARRTRAGRGRRRRPTRAGRAAPEGGRLPAGAACEGAAPFPRKLGLAPGSFAEGETPEAGAEVGVQSELGLGRRKREPGGCAVLAPDPRCGRLLWVRGAERRAPAVSCWQCITPNPARPA